MTTITSYGIKEYTNKHNGDALNIVIDVGILTPHKNIQVNKGIEFFDEDLKIWLCRKNITKTDQLYQVYKSNPPKGEYPDETKSALLFELTIKSNGFEVREFIRGEWEKQLAKLAKGVINEKKINKKRKRAAKLTESK